MSDQAPPKVMCVRIKGSVEEVRAFLTLHPMQAEFSKREGDAVVLEVFVPEHEIAGIDKDGLQVQVLFDASARGRERQKEVGKGNRFEGRQRVPEGLGTKTREPRK